VNEKEIAKRIAVAKARALGPLDESWPWFYLSFADDERFNGACVLQAPDELAVTPRAHLLGIAGRGEVLIIQMTDKMLATIPEDLRNVKLDEKTVRGRLGGETLGAQRGE